MAVDPKDLVDFPTLERVLVAFQKSLSRVSQATNDASKYDPNYLAGKRTLFAVEALDIDLNAGLTLGLGSEDSPDDKIRVDFNAPKELRSSIKFRVEGKPLEKMTGNRLMLSRLDPLKEISTVNRFLAWFWDGEKLVPKKEITLLFSPSGGTGRDKKVTTKTDLSGRLNFSIDPKSGTYSSPVTFNPKDFSLDMNFDWFVQAKIKGDEKKASITLPILKS